MDEIVPLRLDDATQQALSQVSEQLTRQLLERALLGVEGLLTSTAAATTTQAAPFSLGDLMRDLEKLRIKTRHFIIHGEQGKDGKWRPTFTGTIGEFRILSSHQQAPDAFGFVPGLPEESDSPIIEAMGAIWYLTPHIKPGMQPK